MCALLLGTIVSPIIGATESAKVVELGQQLFVDKTLSRDGSTSCSSCHDPARAYADPHARSIGVDGKIGTRNAPGLIGVGNDKAFTWDGRRTRLEDVVIDPLTNPVELALPSTDDVIERLRREPARVAAFHAAFPNEKESPTVAQVAKALASFVRSLEIRENAYDSARTRHAPMSAEAEQGKQLFDGIAGCNECHTHSDASARFSDQKYHHSGIGEATQSARLAQLAKEVMQKNLDESTIGPRVLSDPDWSSLGRFVVSHRPADIGAFLTPSLRNVAVTAPYMHDGSIATLAEAVDHEIYYRGFSSGHPINITQQERQALVKFLETLTDVNNRTPASAGN